MPLLRVTRMGDSIVVLRVSRAVQPPKGMLQRRDNPMRAKSSVPVLVVLASLAIAGCAVDGSMGGGNLTTGSVSQPNAVDPACVALAAKIDGLKQEGTVGRVEQAAAGKSKTVILKRASLSKVAELNQANAEFQSKCSTITPAQRTASAAATTADASKAAASANKSAQ